jgi:LmbE family N-acetylglucosaminyl deacetylase
LNECGIPAKLYYTAFARSDLRRLGQSLTEAGLDNPIDIDANPDFGTPDEDITTTIDCTAVVGRKFASLAAHGSQTDNIFFLQMKEEFFSAAMGIERFVRAFDTTDAPIPESDLFAGIR